MIVYECSLIVNMLMISEGNVTIAAEESEQQQEPDEGQEEPKTTDLPCNVFRNIFRNVFSCINTLVCANYCCYT